MTRETSSQSRWIVGLFAIVAMMGIAYVAWFASGMPNGESTPAAQGPTASASSEPEPPLATEQASQAQPNPVPSPTPEAQDNPLPPATPHPPKVGIVAGHWQSDSGAICPDGLQEATINLDVASRVVAILQHEGYDAELLAEFSDELIGYNADAFVSIHADSCGIPEASGFKVARVAASAIPDEEDRLVACMIQEYAAATGLRFHRDSITFDMTSYHAFSEIDPETPGIIIELGFMEADREILTDHAYEVAQGVSRGISCFLEGE